MNLNEYIDFLAKEIGWKKSDIQRRARSLRDEGLIGTEYSTHGRHARQINIWDCCYLIIAILADGSSSTVAPKAREIAYTKITTDRKYCLDPLMDLEDFNSTNADITFIDALYKIIDDINNKKQLPAVEKISLTINYFNPEEKNMANCRVRIDWNTPLKNKNNLSKIAYSIKEQLTELDSVDQMGSIVQSFFEIENSNEIPDLPDSMKILQSNFGISFDQLSSLNKNKTSEFKKKIINKKYLEAINSNKLFGSESLPNITNHYSLGGQILLLIAENYREDTLSEDLMRISKAPYRAEDEERVFDKKTKKNMSVWRKVKTESLRNFSRKVSANKKIKKDKRNIYLWDYDECILAWALLLENKTLPQNKEDESIIKLSELLRNMGFLRGYKIDDKYRNPTGVYLTIMNMERFKKSDVLNINYHQIKSNLGEVAELVWLDYKENPQELISKSKVIKEKVEKGTYEPVN
ncbi:MAG: hypothetical protein QF864_04435 [SAR202 cluster bacterium]|jgi:hypothetical protein|nr:hypothetical protein [SAR202 cluster bacterium]